LQAACASPATRFKPLKGLNDLDCAERNRIGVLCFGNAIAGQIDQQQQVQTQQQQQSSGESIFGQIGDGISSLFQGVEHVGVEIIGGVEQVGSQIINGVEQVGSQVINGAEHLFNDVVNGVESIFSPSPEDGVPVKSGSSSPSNGKGNAVLDGPRLTGVYVKGNTLVGDIPIVNNTTNLTDEQLFAELKGLNHSYQDGYAVDLQFHSASLFQKMFPDSSVVTIDQFSGSPTGDEDQYGDTHLYTNGDVIQLYAGADAQTVAHEFGHVLGFSDVNVGDAAAQAQGYNDPWLHSQDSNSVMFATEDTQHPGPSYLNMGEATALVNFYRPAPPPPPQPKLWWQW